MVKKLFILLFLLLILSFIIGCAAPKSRQEVTAGNDTDEILDETLEPTEKELARDEIRNGNELCEEGYLILDESISAGLGETAKELEEKGKVKFEDALEYYKKAIKIAGKKSIIALQAHELMGRAYLSLGDALSIAKARAEFNIVIETLKVISSNEEKETLLWAYQGMGHSYLEDWDFAQSERYLNYVIEKGSEWEILFIDSPYHLRTVWEKGQRVRKPNRVIAAAYESRGQVYMFQGLTDAASQEYRNAELIRNGISTELSQTSLLHDRPDQEIAAQERLELGKRYVNDGKLDEAIFELKRVSKISTSLAPAAHYHLGRVYEKQGHTTKANREYSISERLKREMIPQKRIIHTEPQGETFYSPESTTPLTSTTSTGERIVYAPRNPEALRYYDKGLEAHYEKDFDVAMQSYQQAIALEPNWADVHSNLGLVYQRKGMKDEAIREEQIANKLRRGETITPIDYETPAMSSTPLVIPTTTTIKSGPIIPSTTTTPITSSASEKQLYDSALNKCLKGNYAESRTLFNQFLNKYSTSSLSDNAYYWIGESYYAEKNYKEALNYFNRVLTNKSFNQKDDDAQLKIGICYYRLGDYKTAKMEFQKVISNYPKSEYIPKANKWISICNGKLK